jgi:hypothetical protein
MRAVVVVAYDGPDDPDAVARLVGALHDRGIHEPVEGLTARPVTHVAVDDAADRVLAALPGVTRDGRRQHLTP